MLRRRMREREREEERKRLREHCEKEKERERGKFLNLQTTLDWSQVAVKSACCCCCWWVFHNFPSSLSLALCTLNFLLFPRYFLLFSLLSVDVICLCSCKVDWKNSLFQFFSTHITRTLFLTQNLMMTRMIIEVERWSDFKCLWHQKIFFEKMRDWEYLTLMYAKFMDLIICQYKHCICMRF
jgi:hypothetical protein